MIEPGGVARLPSPHEPRLDPEKQPLADWQVQMRQAAILAGRHVVERQDRATPVSGRDGFTVAGEDRMLDLEDVDSVADDQLADPRRESREEERMHRQGPAGR